MKKFEIFFSFLHGETEGFISPCLHPTSLSSCCGLDRAWPRSDVSVLSCLGSSQNASDDSSMIYAFPAHSHHLNSRV